MPKLVCTLENKVVGEHVLDKERITIGRRQDNDIVVDHLAVSGLHAIITTLGRDSFLEDAGSTNGTTVNAAPIKKHILQDGDTIEIGRHHFKFDIMDNTATVPTEAAKPPKVETEAAAPTSLEDTPHTQPMSLKSLIQSRTEQSGQDTVEIPAVNTDAKLAQQPEPDDLNATTPMAIPSAEPIPKLRVLNGSNAGKTLSLNKTLTTLGKTGGEVVVITKRSRGIFVSQVEGNALTVNQKPPASLSVALKHQDIIEISNIQMQFTID